MDDFSRYTWIQLFKNHYELYQIYRDFTKMIETQFSKPIKVFRFDNAQEYKAHEFTSILHQFGTVFHSSCADTSQQNGRAEHKLCHILDVVHATTIVAYTPTQFLGEAALTAVYTINRCPSPIVQNQTPYDMLFGSFPSYDSLRVLDVSILLFFKIMKETNLSLVLVCIVFLGMELVKNVIGVMISLVNVFMFLSLWSFRNIKCFTNYLMFLFPLFSLSIIFLTFFLRYLPLLCLSKTPPPPLSVSESPPPISDVSSHASYELPTPIIDVPTDTTPAVDPASPSDSHALRRSHRVTTLPSHLCDFHFFYALASLQEPQTFHEASSNPLWQQAMKEELDALHKIGTWDLVDLPSEKTSIGCKWVYKIKTRSDGTVDRYKARLIARGFTQEYGIDYEETFAPMARLSSIMTLIVVSATRKWPLFQMDVKNAFLNGELLEEVYMKLPLGYSHPPGFPHKVCRPRRALYDLKQGPRAWFAKFSSTIS